MSVEFDATKGVHRFYTQVEFGLDHRMCRDGFGHPLRSRLARPRPPRFAKGRMLASSILPVANPFGGNLHAETGSIGRDSVAIFGGCHTRYSV